MRLPKDPVMLLSVVNTALRDKYTSLEDLAHTEDIDISSIADKLSQIGYSYDKKVNQFI